MEPILGEGGRLMRRATIAACTALTLACLFALTSPTARALVPIGADGWYWQMPQPAGNLADVTFATATDVWAVGAGGTILHSADGGLTWTAQQSGTFDNLSSVSFVDAQHGWVCADRPAGSFTSGPGLILATSDGGTTWTDVTPAGLSQPLTNVSFVDAEHGWVGASAGRLLATSNGGTSWQTVHVDSASGKLDVDFVSTDRGWAWQAEGNGLWQTTNGGSSWALVHRFTRSHIPSFGMDFTDARHGWACSEGDHSVLFTPADGGRRWRQVLSLPAAEFITALHGSDGATATVASSDFNDFYESLQQESLFSGFTSLRHTTNGGRSWSVSRMDYADAWPALAGSGQRWCAVGSAILTSENDAATWKSQSSGQHYFLDQGIAVSANDLWAVDDAGALLHSTDGASWVEQPQPTRWSQTSSGVSFPTAQDGWLVGTNQSSADNGVILHTTDGGTTWSPQSLSLDFTLDGVDFVDADNGWAISDDSSYTGSGASTAIEHTTNGGNTWTPEWLSGCLGLTAVDFLDSANGWVAGSYFPTHFGGGSAIPAIYKTTNGGLTWTREALPSGTRRLTITSLQFLDQDNGWAVGSTFIGHSLQGWLMKTTNGGSTWARVSPLNVDELVAVHFIDAQHGWIAGDGVYATADGGTTWQEVAGGTYIDSLAATDSSHVWAFGEGLLGTVDAGGGDTVAPQTLDDADWSWHRAPVTITLTANDTGGSGLAGTQYRSSATSTWTSGTSITVAAPADHANDGLQSFVYRSADNAGNVEASELCGVGIDTLGPTCAAPKAAVVDAGKLGIIRFKASDATSGVVRATISIVNDTGHVVRTLSTHSGNWIYGRSVPYYWLHFRCSLKPGLYRIEVRAIDRAGNRQVVVGRNRLHVVTSSAPPVRYPHWPAGLPDTTPGGGQPLRLAMAAGSFCSRWEAARLRR